MNLAVIPNSDLVEFLTLPEEVRDEVETWHKLLLEVTKPISRSLHAIAAKMGVSAGTARRKYYTWLNGRDWRTLINRAKVPEGRGLEPDFIEFWKQLCQQNGRKFLPAYREFVRRFKAGEPIPGIEPGVSRRELPTGFSYDNLIRHKPTPFETTAARIGRSAAAEYRPKVFTTRTGLLVGQFIMFDDMWHDFMVTMVGQRRAGRLLQLHAHDVLSGCQFARGMKMRYKDEETGKSVNLKEDEMLFLVAYILCKYGFHPGGTTFLVEHGTAAIPEWLEKLLFDLSAGKIRVERSGIEGASAFAGQYAGRGKGNFRFKAALESLGNLIHNETANLIQFPGQTGSNARLNCPEELAGREKHMDQLSLALAALPESVRAKLRLPFLEVTTAKWMVDEVMERINQRTEHELEGWLDSGFTTVDMAIPGIGILPASTYLALPPEKKAAIDAVCSPAPRKLSPREVFDAGSKEFIRFRPEQTAMLLKDKNGKEVTVGDDHLIRFEDETISSEPVRYLAHHFAAGDKFRGVVNPWSPETLHLFDARGAWVGVVDAWQTVRKDDVAALHAQMGKAAAVEKELLMPLAQRGAAITRKRLEDSQWNAENLGETKSQRKSKEQHAANASAALLQTEKPAPLE